VIPQDKLAAVLEELARRQVGMESALARTFEMVRHLDEIRYNTAKKIKTFATTGSNSGTIDLSRELGPGCVCTGVTFLDVGGGLQIQLDGEDTFYTVLQGDEVKDEILGMLSWKGAGVGTAVIRIVGRLPS
jgi:hypothetical protein